MKPKGTHTNWRTHRFFTSLLANIYSRESKRAILEEKSKLEREIASIKREKTTGGESSRHNESMSMYFAKSQSGLFSPRNRAENATKSFIANNKESRKGKTSRHQVFMS